MFMTPREIMSQYQPMDADRQTTGGTTSSGSRPSTYTQNPEWPNQTARDYQGRTQRTSGGSKQYERYAAPESDEQLWARKADEASDYGLTDEIEQEGVIHPVRLGRSIGESGKPMVVGGHHRIAAQNELDPDKLMPVMHDINFWSARQDRYYRYR